MFDSPSSSGTVANQACVRAGVEMKFTGGREGLMGAVGNSQVLIHKTSHMLHLDCLRDGTSWTCAMCITRFIRWGKRERKKERWETLSHALFRRTDSHVSPSFSPFDVLIYTVHHTRIYNRVHTVLV